MSKQKLIFFISADAQGGSTIASTRLLDLLSLRTSVKIIGVVLGPKTKRLPDNRRFKWYVIPYVTAYNKVGGFLAEHPSLAFIYTFPFLFIISFFLALKSKRDIVLFYGNGPILGFTSGILGKIFYKQSVMHVHGDAGLRKRSRVMQFLARRCFLLTDYIIVNSEDVKDDLVMSGVSQEKITIVTNWVDLKVFHPINRAIARRKLGLNERKFIALYVGQFSHVKGFSVLLRTAKNINNSNIEFIFIGGGPLEEEIKSFASQKKNIKFIGFIEDERQLVLYYNAADLLVWGSSDITYPSLTVMEALASGLPVLTSNKTFVEKDDSKNKKINPRTLPKEVSFLIHPSPQKLRAWLLFLASNRDGILEPMHKQCRKFAEERFSSHNADEVYNKVFRSFLDKNYNKRL